MQLEEVDGDPVIVGEALVALGVALGVFVALGELLMAGVGVALGVAAVLGCEGSDVGVCVGGVAVTGGVVVGVAGGVAVAPLLATVKSPRRLDLVPSDQVSTDPDGVRSIGELRGVVRERRAAGGGTREVKGSEPFGPNGRLRTLRVV